MERYGSMEVIQSDPINNWEGPVARTGLEESMWQLGLGEEGYPERPNERNCIYYLRTGSCGYGDRCRFNHPRQRTPVEVAPLGGGGDYPERNGQPVCQYYVKTGNCKFGASCKYHHPRQGAGSVNPFALNIYGYPMRPGEKECSYYMKIGQCKFGMTCRFNHPQPINVQVPSSTTAAAVYSPVQFSSSAVPGPQQYGMVTGNWPVVRSNMMPGSYMQGSYGPFLLSSGVLPFQGWAPYPVPNPVTMPTNPSALEASQLYGVTHMATSAVPAYTGTFPAISTSVGPSSGISKEHSFPQRPGQAQCQYYLKTGDCKFGMSCKYHHPTEWVAPEISLALSPMGLPLRPGTPICSFYAQHAICKFGPSCKFDHPMGTISYSSSASSLSDMPVAPYPVGSSMATLAPSSSSSDLRAIIISGSNKDLSPILASSIPISSGSISQSGAQQSHQIPSVSTANSNDDEVAPS